MVERELIELDGQTVTAGDSTTIVVVTSPTARSPAALVNGTLAGAVVGLPEGELGAAWRAMVGGVRNVGRPGLAAVAVSAVDVALWDLKARLLELPLTALLPRYRTAVPSTAAAGSSPTRCRGWSGSWPAGSPTGWRR
jgi:L-alanine-DL-glutamate epimerase-like enolase superfamily enzyme